MSNVPLIYSPILRSPKLSLAPRLFALAIALGCLSMLAIARLTPPSPTGVGTHRALGFQECQFLARSGIPCPTCGMTTATAHFVRGQWLASIYSQPMGFLIALAAALLFWSSLYIAATGRPTHRLLHRFSTRPVIIPLMLFAIAAWAWKIFIHLKHLDG